MPGRALFLFLRCSVSVSGGCEFAVVLLGLLIQPRHCQPRQAAEHALLLLDVCSGSAHATAFRRTAVFVLALRATSLGSSGYSQVSGGAVGKVTVRVNEFWSACFTTTPYSTMRALKLITASYRRIVTRCSVPPRWNATWTEARTP